MRKLKLILCLTLSLAIAATQPAQAAWPHDPSATHVVVGNGSPASCSETAFNTALAQGGSITFSCGAQPHKIVFTTYKQIGQAILIDGGGLITLSGNNTTSLFQVFFNGALDLNNITLSDARGLDGFGTIDNFGQLLISNSTIQNNNSNAFNGGAITNHGTLTITDSILFNNQATNPNQAADPPRGGAIYSDGGTLTITRTNIISNSAHYGGGIDISAGTLNIIDTGVRRNVGFDGGGILVGQNVTATVRRSEFSNNIANYGAGMEVSGLALITNTTFSSNTAQADGGGIWFLNTTGTSQLNSVTFYQNNATNGGAINTNGGSVVLKNTALGHTVGSVAGANCVGTDITADITNFSTDSTCANATVNPDLKLGPLEDNGGATLTHLPNRKSPLVDAVDSCPSVDQRNITRPRGDRCDVGAVEYAPNASIFIPAALRDYVAPFNGTLEVEPNNTIATANGFLKSNVICVGFPDDLNDYYSFNVANAGPVTIELTGHIGQNTNKLQLQLRNAADQFITYAFAPPFSINIANLSAGTYYVRIFYAEPGPYSNNTPYQLRVVYP